MIRLKRAYEKASLDDGTRILVERLWPRGLRKETAKLDFWCKEVSPSTELRKWHHAHLENWDEFVKRYLNELKEKKDVIEKLRNLSKKGTVTMVFASKDVEHNNAVVLKDIVEKKLRVE